MPYRILLDTPHDHTRMHIPETQFKVSGKMGEPIGLGRGGSGYVRGIWEGNGGGELARGYYRQGAA
jgi:hypothetical protein